VDAREAGGVGAATPKKASPEEATGYSFIEDPEAAINLHCAEETLLQAVYRCWAVVRLGKTETRVSLV
jgi:hypothetical protein